MHFPHSRIRLKDLQHFLTIFIRLYTFKKHSHPIFQQDSLFFFEEGRLQERQRSLFPCSFTTIFQNYSWLYTWTNTFSMQKQSLLSHKFITIICNIPQQLCVLPTCVLCFIYFLALCQFRFSHIRLISLQLS